MRALLSSYPPLGQATEISHDKAHFTVLLEVEESRASDPWEVSLWYSAGEQWLEHRLESSPSLLAEYFQKLDYNLHHLYFTGTLDVKESLNFTLKFRPSSGAPWKWVRDHQGVLDGTVFVKTPAIINSNLSAEDLDNIIQDLNPSIDTKVVLSQSPNTKVWSLTTPINPAHGDASELSLIKFGKPWRGNFERWFALIRHWYPWIAPRQGKSHFSIDKEAIVCSFLEKKRGRHLVLLALSGVENVASVFRSDEEGNVLLDSRNDGLVTGVARVVVALSTTFDNALAAAMYHARSIVAGQERLSEEEKKEVKNLTDAVNPQYTENWFDGLTYCTWNALGQRLTEDKILNAVDELSKNDIKITNLIIDDNWQSIDYQGPAQFAYGMIRFEAEQKSFPQGLKHTVTTLRQKHPHLKHVAVWHALLGYWGGISKDGELAKKYKTTEVMRVSFLRRNLPMGGEMTVIAKEDVPQFYEDFYRFLSSCGVDAVKTDAQFCIDTFESAKHRRDLIHTYQDAWSIAHLRHFSNKAISCMSQAPEIIFHSQLPTTKPPILVRNSDDFFPNVPSSHTWHIFANANNSLLTQHLNAIPDWDMFQTVHDYSGFHAAARCVSGGPIYITDEPGHHNLPLIRSFTAQTIRGQTIILRTSVLGKNLDPYTGYDDEILLKIGTYHGNSTSGTSIIGIFNISQRPLSELVHLTKFRGLENTPTTPDPDPLPTQQRYIIRSHVSNTVSQPLERLDPHALVHITLPVRGYDILTAYPVTTLPHPNPDAVESPNREIHIAPLGLVDKMTAAAALLGSSVTRAETTGRITIDVRLKALGVLGIYVSGLASNGTGGGGGDKGGIDVARDLLVLIQGRVVPVGVVRVGGGSQDVKGSNILEIDIQTAWDKMNLQPGWGDEITVSVVIVSKRELGGLGVGLGDGGWIF